MHTSNHYIVQLELAQYCCLVAKSCLTLVTPWTIGRPPHSSVHGISQARILEQVAISFSRGSSTPRYRNCLFCVSCTVGRFFTDELPGPFTIICQLYLNKAGKKVMLVCRQELNKFVKQSPQNQITSCIFQSNKRKGKITPLW